MTEFSTIRAHIEAMSDLLGIVGAMRSLAGIRVLEAQKALPGIRRYALSMADAIRSALLLFPTVEQGAAQGKTGRALIVYMAEHGFVGGFNDRLVQAAEVEAAEAELRAGDALFVIGSRGGAVAAERGWRPAWTHPMPTHLAAAPEMVRVLVAELYRRIALGRISRVEVLSGRYRQGAAAGIECVRLLPLDVARLGAAPPFQPPLHNLDSQALLEKLIADYVFAQLMEAATESMACENAARFSAMNAAHDNVSKRLDELRREACQARQAEITNELLELVTGAAALAGD